MSTVIEHMNPAERAAFSNGFEAALQIMTKAEHQLLKNQLAIMCFMLYGKEDERAKKVLEHRIKRTKILLKSNENGLQE